MRSPLPPATDIRDLLVHAEWLRRLATRLVRDDEAADVLQQTWLAALRSPPAGDRPARPWLAEVLRNFARRTHRDRRARHAREQSQGIEAASAAGPPSAETLLEAAHLQRLLADLVLALDEPYRQTILLRFYQGIEPTEIARQAAVPAGTVRWRVNEAIRRLRAALDSRQETRDWRRALLPLIGASAPASSALKGGVLIMSTKAKLGVLAAAVAALAIGVWSRPARTPPGPSAAAVAADREAPPGQAAGVRESTVIGSPAGGTGRPGPASAPATAAAETVRRRATRPPPPRLVAVAAGTAPAPAAPPAEGRGTLDKDEIRRAMRRVIPGLKQCYARLLEQQPQTSGRLLFQFTITDQGTDGGRISEASVVPQAADAGTPELVDPLTEQCMLNAIAEASFPSPQGGPVVVRYPFNFAPSGDLVPGTAQPDPSPLR